MAMAKADACHYDYAAFMATTLSRWFSELADHSEPRHSLRILMLERHADAHFGWFHDLQIRPGAPGSPRNVLSVRAEADQAIDELHERRES